MVNHDHNRIKTLGEGEVGDEVDRDLFERESGGGWNWTEWGSGRMCVDLVLLANCTASNKMFDKGGV